MSGSLAFILEHCTELSHSRAEPLPRTEQCVHGSLSSSEPGGSNGEQVGVVYLMVGYARELAAEAVSHHKCWVPAVLSPPSLLHSPTAIL